MKTVLVLGALGNLGGEVALAFVAQGWQTFGLVRAGKEALLPKGVIPIVEDVFNTQAVILACNGQVDIVFNGLNMPYSDWHTKALPLYEAVLDLAFALKARHIFPGNVYNFGSSLPPELWADTAFRANTKKGKLRVKIEAMMRAHASKGRAKTLIIRAGDFFGPNAANTWFKNLIGKDLSKGVLSCVGKHNTLHAWAYVPDLAQTIVKLAQIEPQLSGFEVFHFEGHNVSMNEMLEAANEAGIGRVRLKSFPRFLFYLIAPFNRFIGEALEMLYLWDRPHALKDDRIARLTQDSIHTPLDEALKAIIEQK